MEFCKTHGLCAKGSQDALYKRARSWLEMDLEAARVALPEQEAKKFTQTSSCLRRTIDDDLGVQSEAYFMKFFNDNMLPSWGKRDTWIQRVYRFKEERGEGGDITRWAINQDTRGLVQRTSNGIETYRFEANLHRTSVAILKTELLVIGMFPSDSTLDLYFGADRHNALEDDKPLSFYEGQNFRDMLLEVRKVDHEDEISTTDLGCELALTYQPRDPKRSMRSIKDKSRAYAPDPIPHAYTRNHGRKRSPENYRTYGTDRPTGISSHASCRGRWRMRHSSSTPERQEVDKRGRDTG